MRKLLSTGGAARLLGLSRERIGQLVREGRLRVAAVDSTRRVLLRPEDVEQFKARREATQSASAAPRGQG